MERILAGMVASLTLTSQQVIAAIATLEHYELPVSTLSCWAQQGVVVPSVRFVQRRGRFNQRLYNLSDLARARVVVRLRQGGVSMPVVRTILAFLDAELREVLRPRTNASLVYDGRRAVIVRPGQADMDIPSGQLRLKLVECVTGNQETARAVLRSA